jgi:plasmid stabilization system protein ParE
VKIVLLAEARRRFEAEDEWWRENRNAKELFTDEFEQTLDRVAANPQVGQTYRETRGKLIQRVLMKKTRCHVYYFHDRENDLVEVHTIWGARKERGPRLQR